MAEDKIRDFDNDPEDNDEFEFDDDQNGQSDHKGIGEKIRERNRLKYEQGGLFGLSSKIQLNELIGYAAALMFFILAGMVFFRFYDTPGMSPEYRIVLSAVLFLYGVYRVVTTRARANSAKRRQRIESHRSTLDSRRIKR